MPLVSDAQLDAACAVYVAAQVACSLPPHTEAAMRAALQSIARRAALATRTFPFRLLDDV